MNMAEEEMLYSMFVSVHRIQQRNIINQPYTVHDRYTRLESRMV